MNIIKKYIYTTARSHNCDNCKMPSMFDFYKIYFLGMIRDNELSKFKKLNISGTYLECLNCKYLNPSKSCSSKARKLIKNLNKISILE